MARTIRVGDIGDYVNQQMEKLLRAAVLETDSLLKQASPVDTGRFRASWQVGENAAPGTGASEGQFDTGKIRKTSKRGRTAQEVLPIQRIGYQQEKVGNIYSVHNNLPYAEPLAGGSYPPSWGGQYRSKQAEPGWVQGIAKDVQTRVQTAAARIGRES
jgi:hypothetical protein